MKNIASALGTSRSFSLLALILVLGIGEQWASADQFYLATGSNGIGGSLYLINPATGAPSQTIGPLKDGLGQLYGMTGMAFQPGTNVLYGSTANSSPTAAGHLVKIDPATALVTDIGAFGVGNTMSDITFDRSTGILYGAHAAGDHWLYSINLVTGAATKVGTGTRSSFGGGGLAANAAGAMFVTPDGNTNPNPTLQTVDKATGNETVVAPLTGGPLPHIIDAMDFDSSSVLFGIQTTDGGTPSGVTHLVKIDTSTAVVTDIGPSVTDADALAILLSDAYQVRYASNLAIGDSVVNITNTGASSTIAFPTQNGNICANVYTFSPDEQLISCCSCLVTPNALVSLSARNDLISNTLTPGVPTSIVIKLLASAGTTAASCNASTVGTTGVLAPGMAAWGTTIHALPVTPGSPATTYGETETAFTPATLSAAELTRITTLCGYIQANGSGFGICKSCRFGGLGAVQ